MALTYDLLENASARSLPLVQSICFKNTGDAASNAIHQSLHFLHAISCVVALVAQPVVHYKFLVPSALHFNLKVLLVLHFLMSMVYSAAVLNALTYETALWLWHSEPCDIFPTRTFCIINNITALYSLLYILNLQLLMSIERAVATVHVNTYESWKKASGFIYTFPACVVPGLMVLYVYNGESFNEPYLNSLTTPSTAVNRIAVISIVSIVVSLISMVMQRILATINKRRSLRLTTGPLTTRYQLSENISSSNLTSSLLVFEVSATVVQASLTLILPELIARFADDKGKSQIIVAEACFILPIAMAILPFLILHLLLKKQRIRAATIHKTVCQSKAGDVTSVYISMLTRQWE